MCGITGCFGPVENRERLEATITAMTRTLRARGPDHEGVYVDPARGIGLGHRRLSVLDLSPAGNQPMTSACGRYVVTFNGQIYNFESLREQLQRRGQRFRGHSDTEVLLASVVEWGLIGALERFNGMFAFGLWDTTAGELHLARDRMGEKPLYYGFTATSFVFASELKAIRAHPSFVGNIDRDALAFYVSTGCVPAPLSIYRDVFKLSPGHMLTLRRADERPQPLPFWSPKDVAERGADDPFRGDFFEAVAEFDALFADAVAIRTRADVPVGALLSGGVDSSSVVAAMQRLQPEPVQTFTIGFAEHEFDESSYAQAVADHLDTAHTERIVKSRDALAVIPDLPEVYDEPFADSSQVPTVVLSRLAREHVTVVLSGDGGDELFAGYGSFRRAADVWDRTQRPPTVIRHAIAAVLNLAPGSDNARRHWRKRRAFWRRMLQLHDPESVHTALTSATSDGSAYVIGARKSTQPVATTYGRADLPSAFERIMYHEAVDYLPNDILVKVDRASMGTGLEVRAPFLDHRVFEFAARLPLAMKVQGNETKRIVRSALDRHVPSKLVDRPKQGFQAPVAQWLRTDLEDWAATLLDVGGLRDDGFFEPRPIVDRWNEHRSGVRNNASVLWNILMFQAWLEHSRKP